MSRPKNSITTPAAQAAATVAVNFAQLITGHSALQANANVPVREAMGLANDMLDGTQLLMRRVMESDDGEGTAYTLELVALSTMVEVAAALHTACYRGLFPRDAATAEVQP